MPDEWVTSRVGDLADWRGGMTPSLSEPEFWEGGTLPWISSKDVSSHVLTDTERHITPAALAGTSLRMADPGSVVMVVRSGILAHTFPVAYVPFATTVNQDIKVGSPRLGVSGEYLAYLLQALQGVVLSRYRKTGTTVQSINLSALMNHEVSLPPHRVQRRIVDLLAHLDNHLEYLRTEREACELARQAALEQWLGGVAGEAVLLGDVLDIARGGSPRPIDDYFTDSADGLNWIKIGDVPAGGRYITQTAQRIRVEGLSKTRAVKSGDFLLSNSMSFGRPYILRIDGCIHDGWLVLAGVERRFVPEYLYFLLRSSAVQDQFASLAAGSGVKNLNIKVVESVKVTVPPRNVQESLAAGMSQWMDLVDGLDAEITALERVRTELVQALVSRQVEIGEAYERVYGGVA